MLRKSLLAAVLLIAAIAAYRVFGVYTFRSLPCAPASPLDYGDPPERLVVMSFNIQGHASLLRADHLEEVAEVINAYRPDIVGLNEVHLGTWQARFRDHATELERRTGMRALFAPSYSFAGGLFGNAILTRGTIRSQQVHPLPGRGEPRTLLEAVVRVNGGEVPFFVTHTTAWSRFGSGSRAAQLECIARHVVSGDAVLTGDLNAPPASAEIGSFLTRGPLRLAGRADARTHRITETRLDYVVAGSAWKVVRETIVDEGPSDHRAVVVELQR